MHTQILLWVRRLITCKRHHTGNCVRCRASYLLVFFPNNHHREVLLMMTSSSLLEGPSVNESARGVCSNCSNRLVIMPVAAPHILVAVVNNQSNVIIIDVYGSVWVTYSVHQSESRGFIWTNERLPYILSRFSLTMGASSLFTGTLRFLANSASSDRKPVSEVWPMRRKQNLYVQ